MSLLSCSNRKEYEQISAKIENTIKRDTSNSNYKNNHYHDEKVELEKFWEKSKPRSRWYGSRHKAATIKSSA